MDIGAILLALLGIAAALVGGWQFGKKAAATKAEGDAAIARVKADSDAKVAIAKAEADARIAIAKAEVEKEQAIADAARDLIVNQWAATSQSNAERVTALEREGVAREDRYKAEVAGLKLEVEELKLEVQKTNALLTESNAKADLYVGQLSIANSQLRAQAEQLTAADKRDEQSTKMLVDANAKIDELHVQIKLLVEQKNAAEVKTAQAEARAVDPVPEPTPEAPASTAG